MEASCWNLGAFVLYSVVIPLVVFFLVGIALAMETLVRAWWSTHQPK